MSAPSIRCSGCGGQYASCGCPRTLAEREARETVRETMVCARGVSSDELLNAYASAIASRVRAETDAAWRARLVSDEAVEIAWIAEEEAINGRSGWVRVSPMSDRDREVIRALLTAVARDREGQPDA